MAKYDKQRLAHILVKHGYENVILTPQWYQFALQLVTIEKLDKVINELKQK